MFASENAIALLISCEDILPPSTPQSLNYSSSPFILLCHSFTACHIISWAVETEWFYPVLFSD
jgi:hypothetical protein